MGVNGVNSNQIQPYPYKKLKKIQLSLTQIVALTSKPNPIHTIFPFKRTQRSTNHRNGLNPYSTRCWNTSQQQQQQAPLDDDQLAELRGIFRSFDRNNDGSLTQLELVSLLRSLGLKPSADQLDALIQRADTNSNGLVEFSEFVALVAPEPECTRYPVWLVHDRRLRHGAPRPFRGRDPAVYKNRVASLVVQTFRVGYRRTAS